MRRSLQIFIYQNHYKCVIRVILITLIAFMYTLFFTPQSKADDMPPSIDWEYTIEYDNNDISNFCNQMLGKYVRQTPDEGFLGISQKFNQGNLIDSIEIIKLNKDGVKTSETVIDDAIDFQVKAINSNDGGYILYCLKQYEQLTLTKHVIKIFPDGNIQWNQDITNILGASSLNNFTSICETTDGNFLCINECGSIYKFDENGNYVSEFSLVGEEYRKDAQYKLITSTKDNSYVMIGIVYENTSPRKQLMISFDQDFHILNSNMYDLPESVFDSYDTIQQTPDGGFISSFIKEEGPFQFQKAYILKVDSNNSLLWERDYIIEHAHSRIHSIKVNSDGGYTLAGSFVSQGDYTWTGMLIRTDQLGNKIWEKYLNLGEIAAECIESTDQGYVYTGYQIGYRYTNESGVNIKQNSALKIVKLKNKALTTTIDPVICAGPGYSTVLKSDGNIWAWGNNTFGVFGIDPGVVSKSSLPIKIFSGAKDLSVGMSHILVLKKDGTVWSWGDNLYGKLGFPPRSEIDWEYHPTKVEGIDHVRAVAAGGQSSVVIKEDGTVWEWGLNTSDLNDLVGLGDQVYRPMKVENLENITKVSVGTGANFALKDDGTVWHWGTSRRQSAYQLPGFNNIIDISSFGERHIIALKRDGTVWAWGENFSGQLGDGTTDNKFNDPVQVMHLEDIKKVGAGPASSYAIKTDGTVWVWGWNYGLMLGVQGFANSQSSVPLLMCVSDATQMAFGNHHSIVLTENGDLYGLGDTPYGELGIGYEYSGYFINEKGVFEHILWIRCGDSNVDLHFLLPLKIGINIFEIERRLKINPSEINITNSNKDSLQLQAKYINDDGTESDVTLEITGIGNPQSHNGSIQGYWYSNNQGIVTVGDNGELIPTLVNGNVVNGTTEIIVTYKDEIVKVPVISGEGRTDGVYLNPKSGIQNDIKINGQGTGYSYIQLVDVKNGVGTPLANRTIIYSYSGYSDIYSTTSGNYGEAIFQTPELNQSTLLTLNIETVAGISETFMPQTIAATVEDVSFEQEWNGAVGIGAGVSAGLGVDGKIGIAEGEAKIADIGVKGSLQPSVNIKNSYDGNNRKLELKSTLNAEAAAEASAGIFANLKGTIPKVGAEISAGKIEGNAGGSAYQSIGLSIDNYDPNNPEHILLLEGYLLDLAVRSNPGNVMLIKALDFLDLHSYNYTSSGYKAKLGIGAKLGSIDASVGANEVEAALGGIEGTVVYSYDGKRTTNGETTYESGIKADAGYDFGSTSVFGKNLGADVTIKAEHDAQGNLSSLSLKGAESKTDRFLLWSGSNSKFTEFKYTDNDSLNTLKSGCNYIKDFADGNKGLFSLNSLFNTVQYITNSNAQGEYSLSERNEKGFDVPLAFGLKVLVGGELDVNISGFESVEYAYENGLITNNNKTLKQSQSSNLINVVDSQKLTLETIITEPINGIKNILSNYFTVVGNNISNGLQNGWARMTGSSNRRANISKLNTNENMQRSYMLRALPNERSSINESYIAVTIGEPYALMVYNDNENILDDFSDEPVNLELSYTDDMLSLAEITPDSVLINNLKIYYWSQEKGCYICLGGTLDTVGKKVSATITKSGQYILAVDNEAPSVEYFTVSNHTPTPVITAKVSDLSGIDISTFRFSIDNNERVNGSNFENYYEYANNTFKYEVTEPLAEGNHTASITVSDTSGNELPQAIVLNFQVDTVPPNIEEITIPETISSTEELNIFAFVTDSNLSRVITYAQSGEVNSPYTTTIPLEQAEDGHWYGVVPNPSVENVLKVKIVAYDEAENKTESEEITVNIIVDKTELIQKLQDAENIIQTIVEGDEAGKYQVGTIDMLQNAIDNGNCVIDNQNATQGEIDQASAELESSLEALHSLIISGNKSSLDTAITYATDMLNSATIGLSAGNVPQEAYDNYDGAIISSIAVKDDLNASQTQIDDSVLNLILASLTFNNSVIKAETLTVSNPTSAGFTVTVSSRLVDFLISDFILNDAEGNPVNITSVTTINGGTAYDISAALKPGYTYMFTMIKNGYDFGTDQVIEIPVPWVSGLSATGITHREITVNWDAIIDASYYNIYRSSTGNDSYVLIGTSQTNSYSDGELPPGKSCWYKVSAVINNNEGPMSDPLEASTLKLAVIQFNANVYVTAEENSSLTIEIIRFENLNDTVTVDYSIQDGTAIQDEDYQPTLGTITFVQDETIKTISIPIIDDSFYEADETLILILSNPSSYAELGSNSYATITIKENDYSESTGMVQYFNLEGGFFGIIGDDGQKYRPVNQPKDVQDGDRVSFKWIEIEGAAGYQMWGKAIRIVSLEVIDDLSRQPNIPARPDIPLPGTDHHCR